jgi:hypothetical protein
MRPEGSEVPAALARDESRNAPAARPVSKPKAKAKRGWRAVYLKQLHLWHWVSAAVSLVGMLLFAVTGITLNHAATIGAEPEVVTREAQLPSSLVRLLSAPEGSEQPLPAPVAAEVEDLVDIGVAGRAAEWSPAEVYVAVPGPGSDAWVSIDRTSGAIMAEATDRGLVSFANDLHKGRNTGTAWFWFIDVFSVACVVFTLTGLLLLQLHSRHRRSTWPLVGLGTAIPLVIVLFFLHV